MAIGVIGDISFTWFEKDGKKTRLKQNFNFTIKKEIYENEMGERRRKYTVLMFRNNKIELKSFSRSVKVT